MIQHRVVWKEGLFIRPQHFQQSDRYFTDELMIRTKELSSNAWGFFDIDIDTHHLTSGKIVINSASGVMPDGTLFYISSKVDSLRLDIKIEDASKEFYLALPITMHNSDEVHFKEQTNRLTRLIAENIDNVPNSNAGEMSETSLLSARYNFKLLLEEEINEGYVNMKIGNIGDVSVSGIVSLDETYIATYLHLHASDTLLSKINELVSTLSYRAEKLSEKLSDSNVQATELGDYLMLQLLNKTKSRLHYYLTQDRIHPSELFLELTSLVGELAVFMKKEKRIIEEFVYDHEYQGESFNKVITELNDMLSMVLEQNSISLPVEKQKYGIYTSKVAEKSMINSSSFVFAVKADIEEDQLKKLLLSNLKMGSIETIRDLVNYHLGGFKLKPLATAPRQIPYKVNYIYFKVELEQEDKEKLVRSGGFAFHLSGELPNVEYTLWAIRND
ncbi:type VI secretion system baseplate subunit TssK [Sulfurimonas sp.]|uniref:type VI secretion system baseplate subunit TssK n=1 Tax=Sulfurimonas sp. TaxID=2022749 RepID=UPI002B47490B|nr:type VI secretion system baseplate subunit TssK [Sulfurimonas sp.]